MRHLLFINLCGWPACTLHTRQNNKNQVMQKHIFFSWWWAHRRPKHVEIDKYTKKKLCTNLVLFTRFSKLFIWTSYRAEDFYNAPYFPIPLCALRRLNRQDTVTVISPAVAKKAKHRFLCGSSQSRNCAWKVTFLRGYTWCAHVDFGIIPEKRAR
jgi:hypothetical protein